MEDRSAQFHGDQQPTVAAGKIAMGSSWFHPNGCGLWGATVDILGHTADQSQDSISLELSGSAKRAAAAQGFQAAISSLALQPSPAQRPLPCWSVPLVHAVISNNLSRKATLYYCGSTYQQHR
jgi:hypothetical protein